MSSILTNTSSMVALQTLKGINKGMAKVQDEISTGLKVATAKDNSSSWSIASTMKSDVGSYKKLGEALTSASAMVGVARTAAEQISEHPEADPGEGRPGREPGRRHAHQAAGRRRRADRHDHLDRAPRPQYNGINLVDARPATARRHRARSSATTAGALDARARSPSTGVDLSTALGAALTARPTPRRDARSTRSTRCSTRATPRRRPSVPRRSRIEAQNDFLSASRRTR